MRLLLRSNSHRPLPGAAAGAGYEIASSPDTPTRPDRWSWHIRLLGPGPADRAPEGSAVELVELGAESSFRVLEVAYDPRAVSPEVQTLRLEAPTHVQRDERDLTVVVVSAGEADVEDRHRLGVGDVLVLAGDDPLSAVVAPRGPAASLALVTLRGPGGAGVPWVP